MSVWYKNCGLKTIEDLWEINKKIASEAKDKETSVSLILLFIYINFFSDLYPHIIIFMSDHDYMTSSLIVYKIQSYVIIS